MKTTQRKHEERTSHESRSQTEATDLLEADHDKVRDLFQRFRKAEDDDREKARLQREIDMEVSVHAQVEEEIFYPAVRSLETEDAERQFLEAREEHALVKSLLKELRGMKASEETFDAKMKVVMDLVEHHADEEEGELLRTARELGEEELRRLGVEIAERKVELQARFQRDGALPTRRSSRSQTSRSGSGSGSKSTNRGRGTRSSTKRR